ncbi:glycosyl hydrolase 2 galactose-binding domain-containing protein [Vallitalea guaymasensis]|uniref:glycosyl hydrolase 2 galactose-binding domain-containing protein n=1 Tax=Vallitalea guaymasensis TaxID=1185412 RepID=UPI00272AAB30|nr:sugar-binding domain-containing protein [Vallitalea guaymasensis]
MAKVDGFARIALNGIDNNKEELEEIKPAGFVKEYFKSSEDIVSPIIEKSYQEKLDDFSKGIEELKQKYLPFLEDYTPKLQMEREQFELNNFQFRYEDDEDKRDFTRVLNGEGEFQQVTIPDYKGPIGKWTGYYRKEFQCDYDSNTDERIYIRFLGVDYIANVYLNGKFIGNHEGFFAPFEFDVTDYIYTDKNNTLVVEVQNDAPTLGIDLGDGKIDGDKIYAATGYGWDDSEKGWHHCPPGAGICHKIIVEKRNKYFINDIFVRPDIDKSKAEVWVEIYNTDFANVELNLKMSIYSKNFKGYADENIEFEIEKCGPYVNYYRTVVDIKDMKIWESDNPYLYKVRMDLFKDDKLVDQKARHFGMRKFHMDETEAVKGTLYLNNEKVILRGANTMGHMQQCVYNGDFDLLIKDILIAKYCNMNYYRLTQRPVQEEIYDYCDCLGMLLQTDLPFFGWIRRNKFCEAIKQSEEMERLIRSHPSNIMVTYINEPFPASWGFKGHRSLLRNEMEEFFEAASKAIRLNNPDRVIKNVEGDYDPPTRTGLSDFHCYNMWYTNHALPIGKLHKGYLPAIKKGWKTGCGEYGTEGLDPLEIMLEDYPKDWIPDNIHDQWTPQDVVNSQSYTMHGDWFEEQDNIVDWIKESQKHQALATKLMNDAFRRRSDVLISTAVHLLIDAWPSGWMKTLVDYRRKPKPAYFTFKETLEPVRVNLRSDKFTVYTGEEIEIECFTLNDTPKKMDGKIIITIRTDEEEICSFEKELTIQDSTSIYCGSIKFVIPEISNEKEVVHIDSVLINNKNEIINQERLDLVAMNRDNTNAKVTTIGFDKSIEEGLNKLNLESDNVASNKFIVIDKNDFENQYDNIIDNVKNGGKALISLNDIKECNIEGQKYGIKILGEKGADSQTGKGLFFVARNENHNFTKDNKDKDYSFMYDKKTDSFDFITEDGIVGEVDEHILFTYKTPEFGINLKGPKEKVGILSEKKIGKGTLYFSTIKIDRLLGENPYLDKLIKRIMK